MLPDMFLKQIFKYYIISGHLQVLFLTFIYSGMFAFAARGASSTITTDWFSSTEAGAFLIKLEGLESFGNPVTLKLQIMR